MSRSVVVPLALILTVLVAISFGCSKKPPPAEPVAPPPPVEPAEPAPPPPPPPPPEPPERVELADVFFDFDKYNLRADARATMAENARLLTANAGLRILIEGHCDERGTVEYNLALGDRRATTVKEFFESYGIAGDRIATISYGEERPFAHGHMEDAWAKNRRAHFVIQE